MRPTASSPALPLWRLSTKERPEIQYMVGNDAAAQTGERGGLGDAILTAGGGRTRRVLLERLEPGLGPPRKGLARLEPGLSFSAKELAEMVVMVLLKATIT